MRITRVRATNVLSFENFVLDLDAESLAVLVGPNGAGKTNVFRVVTLVWDALQAYAQQGRSLAVQHRLRAWSRDPLRDVTVEVDIIFDADEEQSLITEFVRASVANSAEFAAGLGSGPPSGQWDRQPQRSQWVTAVGDAVTAAGLAPLMQGTLGLHLAAGADPAAATLYYAPAPPCTWVWMLNGTRSIMPKESRWRLSHFSSVSLTRIWVENIWAEATRQEWRDYVSGQHFRGPSPALPSLDFGAVVAHAIKDHESGPVPIVIAVDVEPAQARSGIPLDVRMFGLTAGGTTTLTFDAILAHILAARLTVSEDLLSPPEVVYSAVSWRQSAEPLQSRHLGAHLLDLKIGPDAKRKRYLAIQALFSRLSGRNLDTVVVGPDADSSGSDADSSKPASQQIELVQSTGTSPRSVRLRDSGSGLVELAYLCAVLNLPGSHVLLLDEPGRALHPQALTQLGRFLSDGDMDAQIVLITHSPYLVPSARPDSVTRLAPSDQGTTTVHRLTSSQSTGVDSPETDRDTLQRQDQWGRSTNWRAALFASSVLLVDGETELGALQEWYLKEWHEPIEAIGASLLALGSKTLVGRTIKDLDSFGIPWLALVDGDSLKPDSGNIWHELCIPGRLDTTTANAQQRCPSTDQILRLLTYDVFVSGEAPTDNFETYFVSPAMGQLKCPLPEGLQSKVLRGRLVAQQTPCPTALKQVFGRLRTLAGHHAEVLLDHVEAPEL